MGMLTLFGFATGDAVTPLTHDCMVQPPHCDPSAPESRKPSQSF